MLTGGHGIGDYIEIDISGYNVCYIALLNGFCCNETTYYENSRVKSIRLDLIEYSNNDEYVYSKEINCEDFMFTDLNGYNFPEYAAELVNTDSFTPVNKIRITILDVYEGTKYEDTCISEVYILGYPHSR